MQEMSRAKKIFFYAAPFPAMAAFKIWASQEPGPSSLLAASAVMFAYCLMVLLLERHWWRPGYFEWVTTIYFVVIMASLALWPQAAGTIWIRYSVTGIYSCLFTASFIPPLFGADPFTYHYAKLMTSEQYWNNPIFVNINRVMTNVWSTLFAVCIILSLYPSVITRAVIPLGLIVGFGVPFNRRYPDYYLKKLGLPGLEEQRAIADDLNVQKKVEKQPRNDINTAWEAVTGMTDGFDAEVAGDMDAVIRFMVSGNETFETCLEIQNGECRLAEKPSRNPDLIIRTPADVWLAIAQGKLDGAEAFAEKAYTAEGDLSLLLKLDHLFK